MAEHTLTVALQDGFEDDAVTVRVGNTTVIDRQPMRTDQRIGLAYAVDVACPEPVVTLDVRVPDRALEVSQDIDVRRTPFASISVLDGRLVVTTSETPFGYA